MHPAKRLEFDYADRLRKASANERRALYAEAYAEVGALRTFRSERPEDRTAGTSKDLVEQLAQLFRPDEHILEVGCGRGYTCMMLAPHVGSITGTDVSAPALTEARELLRQRGLGNAAIEDVSALELRDRFGARRFDAALSIEVVEHLHPDDAAEHFRQVFDLLRPGGRYAIVMPSRLDGPHDITREEFPAMQQALGFHLNESTYRDVVRALRAAGFRRFRSILRIPGRRSNRIACVPAAASMLFEAAWQRLPMLRRRRLARLIEIRLVAIKP